MSVKSGQAVTVLFTTANASTGAATDATGDPVGTLYVNGTADAASVTVTKITTGVYKAAVTLPALSAGDQVSLRIAATVATVAGEGVIWQETADTYRTSDIETLVDDLETNLATTDGKADQLVAAVITNAAGTDIAADIIALKTVADTIQADTDLLDDEAGGLADIHTDVAAVKTVVDAVKTKTDYLPSATAGAAGGVFIAGTNAPVTITGSGNALTLTSTGANGKGLAAYGNGSGQGIYAKGGATATGLLAAGGDTSGNGITGSATSSGIGISAYSASGSAMKAATDNGVGLELVGTTSDIDAGEIADINTDVAAIATTIGVAGAGLTAVPWNAAWDAEVQSECTDALNAYDPPTKADVDTACGAVTLANGAHGGAAATLALGGAGGLTGAITGNLSGSVGSVTGAVGSVTGMTNQTADVADLITTVGVAGAGLTAITGATLHSDYDAAKSAASQTSVNDIPTNSELATALGDIPTADENADALIGRNIAGGSSTGRLIKDVFRLLRNKVTIADGTMTVYDETDEGTPAWTATVTGTAGADPVTTVDPA